MANANEEFWLRAVGDDDYVASIKYQNERKKLSEKLQLGIKLLVNDAFSDPNKTDPIIDEKFPSFLDFSNTIECALTHGLRTKLDKKKDGSNLTFWNYIENLEKVVPSASAIITKIRKLDKVKSLAGRGRAFLRMALNQSELDQYLGSLVNNNEITKLYYEDYAYLCNHSDSSFFLTLLIGLNPIQFKLNVDDPEIDYITLKSIVEPEPVQIKKKKKKVKKSSANIEPAHDQHNTLQSVIDNEVKKRQEELDQRELEFKRREEEMLKKLEETEMERSRLENEKLIEEERKKTLFGI